MASPITPILKTLGSGFKGLFGLIFKIKWKYWLSIILVIQAVVIGVQSSGGTLVGGVSAFFIALGDIFFNFINNLGEVSSRIITSGAKFDDFFDMIGVLWEFIYNSYLIFFWIMLLTKFYGWTPFSNESNKFINLSLAVVTFWIVNIVYLFYLKYDVGSAWLVAYSFWQVLLFPIFIFIDFIKAVALIITSTSFNTIIDNKVNETATNLICNDNFCVA